MVVSSSACCWGTSGQRTSGPQLLEPDHPPAGTGWEAGGLTACPPVAYRNFTPSLGVGGLYRGRRCLQLCLEHMGGPLPGSGDH